MKANIITPVVTALDHSGKPDYEANKKIIDFLIQNQVDGILVLGSTGEFTEFSAQEKRNFLEFYADYVQGRTELYAGTGSTNFQETLELSNAALDMGYRAALVIPPYYFGMRQEQLFAYYDALAKGLKGDLYIYNYPERSGLSVSGDSLHRLIRENPNVAGMKDTSVDPAHTNQICRAAEGTRFQTYSGYDDQFLYNLAAGGAGVIGALSNVVPDIWSDLVRAARAEDFQRTMALMGLIDKLVQIYGLGASTASLVKMLLNCRGVEISPKSIFPFEEGESAAYQTAKKLLDEVMAEYEQMKAGWKETC